MCVLMILYRSNFGIGGITGSSYSSLDVFMPGTWGALGQSLEYDLPY